MRAESRSVGPGWPGPGPRRESGLPDLPRRPPRGPEALEEPEVAEGVHALPELPVAIGHELALAGEAFQRLALPARLVVVDVMEDLGLEDEEAAVDPSLAGLGLLGELGDAVALEDQAAEPG